jgi:hypothetical protein
MVRIKRNANRRCKGFASQITLSMHFCVLVQFLALMACFGFYMMLESQEVRTNDRSIVDEHEEDNNNHPSFAQNHIALDRMDYRTPDQS